MKIKFQTPAPSPDTSTVSKQDRRQPAPASRQAVTLARRIERSYPELPPSEKAVADLLLDFPGRLATHSATELAELAKSSKAAVTRCIQRIGYASFAQARREAREAQQWGSPLHLDEGAPPRRPAGARAGDHVSKPSRLAAHFAAEVEALKRTRDALSEVDLRDVARALARSRRVVVIGFRNSHLLAGFARAQLGSLRAGVELVPTAGETLAEGLAGLSDGDVVLAVGFRRRVPTFVRAMEAAHRAGARIVYLTDPGGGLSSNVAAWTLRCHCRGASLFDSYVGALSVLNHLAVLVADVLGEPARKRLLGIERMHGELGDLV